MYITVNIYIGCCVFIYVRQITITFDVSNWDAVRQGANILYVWFCDAQKSRCPNHTKKVFEFCVSVIARHDTDIAYGRFWHMQYDFY